MNPRKQILDRVRGWLPKEPTLTNRPRVESSQGSVWRFSALLFPAVAAAMIAAFFYTSLLVFYEVPPNASVYWGLLVAYLTGVEVAIIGFAIRTRLNPKSPPIMNKPVFAIGFVFLTLGVFGFLFDRFFSALNATYPFSIHSLLVRLLILWRVGWLTPICAYLGSIGGFLLLVSGALFPKESEQKKPFWKKRYVGFYLLGVGATIMLSAILTETLSLLSVTVYSWLNPGIYALFAFAVPLGIVCLTLGWAAVAALHSRNRPLLLPALYAAFLALMVGLYFIPI